MEDEPQSPTSKSGVRRPMNAFLIFCKRHRSLVRERNPRLDNRSVTRILGELWAKLPLEEKSTYTSLANEYKEAFLKANPDYKWFNPEKNSAPSNRDKPSTRPSNCLTSYTGQIPHTDDHGPISPTHTPITSQQFSMLMDNKTTGEIPFSTSLTNPQGAPLAAQGIPIFPISMATQQGTLSVAQPVTSISQAMTTLAMVGGQPVMVSQTPLMVSLPQQPLTQQQLTQQQQLPQQQQFTPLTMVTTHLPAGTINSTATTLSNHVGNQVTKLAAPCGPVASTPEKIQQQDNRNIGLYQLAQMCSTEHAKISTTANKPTLATSFSSPPTVSMATVSMAMGPSINAAPGGHHQNEEKPRLDSKVLQGQVKQALGFQMGDLDKGKDKVQNPRGVNHVLDYSLKKNKEAEMAKSILRKDAVKSFGVEPPPTQQSPKPPAVSESLQLSKLVLDHVIEAMYSHETVKPQSAPLPANHNPHNPHNPLGASQSQTPQQHAPPPDTQSRSRLMLTFGEIQERVIRSAVEQSDYNDLLRIKSNPQGVATNQREVSPYKVKDGGNLKDGIKPTATVTTVTMCDAKKKKVPTATLR